MYGYYWRFDPTYLLIIIGMLLSLAASAKLKNTFAVYRGRRSASRTYRSRGSKANFKCSRNY